MLGYREQGDALLQGTNKRFKIVCLVSARGIHGVRRDRCCGGFRSSPGNASTCRQRLPFQNCAGGPFAHEDSPKLSTELAQEELHLDRSYITLVGHVLLHVPQKVRIVCQPCLQIPPLPVHDNGLLAEHPMGELQVHLPRRTTTPTMASPPALGAYGGSRDQPGRAKQKQKQEQA